MPRLHTLEKSQILDAIAAGLRPTASSRGGTLRLPLDNGKHKALADSSGKLTPAGEFYYERSGAERPRGPFDPTQQLIQRKNKDYIQVYGGALRLVRTYNPQTGKYTFTKMGERFFADRHVRYDVKIPIAMLVPLSSNPTLFTASERSEMSASAILGMPPLTVDDRD